MIPELLCLALLQAAPTHSFEFTWSLGGQAEVTEMRADDGVESTLRYRLSLEPTDAGDLVMRRSGFRLIESGGTILDQETLPPSQRQALAMEECLPGLAVQADGRAKDWVGMDSARSALAKVLAGKGSTQAVLAYTRSQVLSGLYDKHWIDPARLTWNRWVEVWSGAQFGPEKMERGGEFMAFAQDEERIPARFTFHPLERLEQDGRDCLRLKLEAHFSRNELGDRAAEYVLDLGLLQADLRRVDRVKVVHLLEAIVDEESGLPLQITARRSAHLGKLMNRGHTRESLVRLVQYNFRWDMLKSVSEPTADEAESPGDGADKEPNSGK